MIRFRFLVCLLMATVAGLVAQPKTAGAMNDVTGREDAWFKKGSKPSLPPNERILRVIVRDDKGEPVQGAAVTLRKAGSETAQAGITLAAGSYVFTGLDRGSDYEIVAEQGGRKSDVRKLSRFLPDQRVSISVALPPAKPKAAPDTKADSEPAKKSS